MKAMRATGTVSEKGVLTAQLPEDIHPGEHKLVIVVEDDVREKTTIIGRLSDESELLDDIVDSAFRDRETSSLRTG